MTQLTKNKSRMKKYFLISAAAMLFRLPFSYSQPAPETSESKLEWHTSLEEVHQLSKTTQKPIFAFFTGSDWCGWCKKLQRDVFAKPEFIEWAQKNVILFELDFPRTKQLPQDLAQQNNSLAQALGISGYPTVWLLFTSKDEKTNNFNLSTIGSLGYPRDAELGNEQVKFLNDANAILNQVKGK